MAKASDARPLRPQPVITGHDSPPPGTTYRRPQGLDYHLLVLTLGGAASIGPAGGRFPQRTGDAILIDPGAAVDQDVGAAAPWRRVWVIFEPRPHWHDWLAWPQLAPGFRQIHLPSVRRGASPVRDYLEAVHRHATTATTRRRWGEWAMNALEAALLACDAVNPRGAASGIDPRVGEALDFISRNLREPMSLERIADAAGLSAPHVVKLFRAQLDLSPMQFVERQRMRRATELLQMTSQSVSEVAAAVGFDDPFYFSTRFKRHTGRSPRAYRQLTS